MWVQLHNAGDCSLRLSHLNQATAGNKQLVQGHAKAGESRTFCGLERGTV
ncbi:hypothetical protein GGR93_001182 [Sulfitobacter noctilucicola]|uniref:Uncharacterized protein n=1 Tax=Sulfitobacter noctilucicola TaxID=1342301 RepID=A0A7W6M8K2_9RHOB|nr:hypothetical protein [Sulfitobacter noctilucicola]